MRFLSIYTHPKQDAPPSPEHIAKCVQSHHH